LDGVDDFANAPDSNSLDLGTFNDDFTIELFFYVPSLSTSGGQTLVYKNYNYYLFVVFNTSTPDVVSFRVWLDQTNYVTLFHQTNLSVGWHHVAAVFDNEFTTTQDRLMLYLNGNRVAINDSYDWTPGLINSSSPLYVGGINGGAPFNGMTEEIRFSRIVRYSNATYTVPTLPFTLDANTRALWRFNESVGSTSFGDIANGNTLTGHNGAHIINP